MIDIIDFSNCELSEHNLHYAGRAGEKRGIIYNNENWFLKFPKNTLGMRRINDLSYVTSPLSEYIGSHIYEILGYDVHKTLLGVCYDGKRYKNVCACKDFIEDDKNEVLIPYTALRNDTNIDIMEYKDTTVDSASNLNEIIFQLDHNTILKEIKEAKERFWDCVCIDILINNNDRNEDNWGVIRRNNNYFLAPIYDNGNSFYAKTDEERIKSILNNKERLVDSATCLVTAYEDNEKRLEAKQILKLNNTDFKHSLNKVYNNIVTNYSKIESLINDIPENYNDVLIMSSNRKEYYNETMKLRLELMKKYI